MQVFGSQVSPAPCAIILAAGVGRRLGASHTGPKCLLDFAGKTLLRRHIAALHASGVTDIAITVGFEQAAVRAAVAGLGLENEIAFIENPQYREGSLVSLWVQAARLRAGRPVILMDADVLCDARMVARLAAAPSPGEAENRLLLDREIEPGDEPVKICFRDGVIVDFRKAPEHAYDSFGESVGFFRFSSETAKTLAARCDDYVREGRLKVEYEEAIRDLILSDPSQFAASDVSDLPWTEIDFEQDVVRARDHILPELVAGPDR